MKNRRIIQAYDSINPSPADKQRMLDAILQEANLEEAPRRERKVREPVMYSAKPTKNSRRGFFGGLAACLAVLLMAGVIFTQMGKNQTDDPSLMQPGTEATEEKNHERTTRDHYAPVLEKYRRAISEGWTKEACEIEGISPRVQAGADVSKTGYALLDLDGDGREELLIAEECTDRTDNIWDLYTTLEDGTPIQLWVDELEGGQCRLYEDNVISISYSMKDELEQTFYDLQAGQMVMREMLQWEDEDTVFHTDADGNTRQVTSREGQSISYAYENQKLSLIWLSDDPDYLRDTDSVEEYTPILEKYRTALIEDWSQYLCMEADISPELYPLHSIRKDLGWCLLDIDENGNSELIISDGDNIYDIFTLLSSDGAPGHLISRTEDLHYFIEEDGTIECQRTENGILYWTDYQLSGEDLIVKSVMTLGFNSGTYRYGLSEQGLQPLSSVKAQEYIDGSRSKQLMLTPFIESPDYSVEEMQLYDPLLSTYQQAISEGWKPGACVEKGISLMVGYYGDFINDLGYKLLDLDGNGFEELIITDGTNIYDMYTIIEDEGVRPFQLFTAMERIEYFLTTDGQIYNLGSGSASVSYYMLYELNGSQLDLQAGYMMDYETSPSAPWFYYDGVERGDPCPTSEAAAVTDAIHFAEIPFIPFE